MMQYLKELFSKKYFLLILFISIFILWLIIYISIHFLNGEQQGRKVILESNEIEVVKQLYEKENNNELNAYTLKKANAEISKLQRITIPTQEQKDSLNILKHKIQSIDSVLSQDLNKRTDLVNSYLRTIDIKSKLSNSELDTAMLNLSQRRFEAKSYFFLKDYWVLLEIIMFALLGVICNCLYFMSEFIRKGEFDKNETGVYFVKLFYAPVIVLIIYLGAELFLVQKSNILPSPSNTIVFSFILGFFSGRAIVLLTRIKDALFPPKTNDELGKAETNETDLFLELSEDEQERVVNEFIQKNADRIKSEYPEIIELVAGQKGENPKESIYLIIAIIEENGNKNLENIFPKFYLFEDSKGNNFNIPTEVVIDYSPALAYKAEKEKLSLNIVEEALLEQKQEWMAIYKADDILAALKVVNGQRQKVPCFQFVVANKSVQDNTPVIPPFITYQNFKIPTDVVQEDTPSMDGADAQVGDAVWRKGTHKKGTLGIKVYRKNDDGSKTDYLLSCYHVFCSKELKNGIRKYNSSSVDNSISATINNSIQEIGQVVEGEINAKLDAALSKINHGISVSQNLKGFIGMPKYGIRLITNDEVEKEIKVFTYGAVSKKVSGTVISRITSRYIEFYGKRHFFYNIIPVTKISVPGDSGAMVVDEKGKIIGIVFASNNRVTYLIPILELITHFNIKIYYA
jgi:hypothetical protein